MTNPKKKGFFSKFKKNKKFDNNTQNNSQLRTNSNISGLSYQKMLEEESLVIGK